MGGSSQTTQNGFAQTVKPLFNTALNRTMWAYKKTPKTPYAGKYSADINPMQRQSVNWLAGVAPKLDDGYGKVKEYADSLMSGTWLKPETNPYLSGMAEAATRGATDNFNRNVLPQLDSQAIASGAYGGSRNGVLAGVKAGEVDKNIRDTYANIYGDNYARERGYMQDAPNLYGYANQLALAPAQAMAQAGAQKYTWDQQRVNDQLARWNDKKSAPWGGLNNVTDLLRMFMQGTSNSTTTKNTPWWQQALQGGLGIGGMLGGMIG